MIEISKIFMKKNFFFYFVVIISMVQITFQDHKPGCEKEFFMCNDQKCSEHSQCYYDSKHFDDLKVHEFSAMCICDPGYETYYMNKTIIKDKVQCCYKLKKLYLAFIYECFIGFGFGYLYLGNYNIFFIKFTFQASICCIVCFSGICLNFDSYENKNNKEKISALYRTLNIFNFFLISIFIIWRIYDFFLFGLNEIRDSNGIRLYNEW